MKFGNANKGNKVDIVFISRYIIAYREITEGKFSKEDY